MRKAATTGTNGRRGMALVMVIAVLGILAIIGVPFVVSMMLHDRASQNFSGAIKARQAAESYRNRAIAGLEATQSAVEWEEEYEELEEERELQRAGRRISLLGRGPSGSRTRGQAASGRRPSGVRGGGGAGQPGANNATTAPAGFSSNGPAKKDFDTPDEITGSRVNFPPRISLPRNAPEDPNAERDGEVSFRAPRGITASADIVDEQGKININTAPPNLIANLFGVTRLRSEFSSKDKELKLDDSTVFRGDDNDKTIDGAVVLVHPAGNVQALTYRVKRRTDHTLGGLFPGSFLSGGQDVDFPAGSFVYDLKGWKIGFHRFWSERYGGFHPDRLTSFRAVESIREIAHWQITSLFVGRFRGEGIDMDLLKKSGVRTRSLGNLGLDPAMFADDGYKMDVRDTLALGRARKQLARQGFSTRFLQKIQDRRGPYMLLDLAARLRGAAKNEARKVRDEIEEMLAEEKESRRSLKMDSRYLKAAFEQLRKVYATAGIETILAEDLEYHRDALTVSSRIASRWSEAQSIGSDLSAGGSEFKFMVPRAPEFNPGTVVRLRRLDNLDRVEFNVISKSAGSQDGGVSLAYPPRASYRAYKAVIEALQRHPVNVNTASEKVLRAVFTGVRGRDKVHVVTPYEAAMLAVAVRGQVPLRGHEDFYAALQAASSGGIIDDEDVKPLFINAVQPTNYFLRQSTTGLCYSTADVYTIEARAILRTPAGGELAGARFREIVEVCPAGVRLAGMVSQADYADGIFLQDPKMTPRFPENNHRFRLRFTGTLSHLVESRPVMLHRGEMIFPGADVSTLRLLTTQTPKNSLKEVLFDEVLSFEDTYEGLELERGQPYELSIGGGGGQGANQPAVPAAAARGGGAGGDLTTKPAGVEFWFRMKTYPQSRSRDGYYKLVEGGVDPDRNRMVLLYDDSKGRVLFRIYDSSLPDPLMKKDRDNGSFLQIEALRGLELETWYHVKLAWDGTFGGGAQLFIDGIPAGKDNLSTELTTNISGSGKIGSIGVKDASRFPSQGSVRIGSEIFEYIGRSKNSLRVRPLPPSHWKPLPITGLSNIGGASGFLPPGADAGAGQPDPAAGGAGTALPAKTDPRLWNGRGSIPSPHPAGSLVSLHGYSLEIRRKVAPTQNQGVAGANPFGGGGAAGGIEHQVADGDSTEMVWGTGGMSTAERLNAWNFPQVVRSGIYHYFDRYGGEPPPEDPTQPGRNGLPGGVGGANPPAGQDEDEQQQGEGIATNGDIIVPLFKLPEATDQPDLPGGIDLPAGIPGVPGGQNEEAQKPEYTGMLMGYNRSSSDYFQSRGICHFRGKNYEYQRIPLPPEYLQALNKDPKVEQPPTMGLKLIGPYPREVGGEIEGLTGAAGEGQGGGPVRNDGREQRPVIQLSILANGVPLPRYPSTGVLEIRGMPSPWEIQSGRPNMLGRPLMQAHPDDTVEWVRYREVFQNMFVGRLGSNSNFRGYPVREQHNYLKKQMDIPAGQPIRLVMELGQGGAGWGDYVTITTSDPDIYETMQRRVYKAFEHEDGRFFVSLVDVDRNGREMPVSRGVYRNNYFRGMNPRMVKFPSWGLPEISTGSLTLFGDAKAMDLRGGGGGARGNSANRNQGNSPGEGIGGDESNGITLDEVRRFENRRVAYDPTYGPRVKYVLVPLKGGRVEVGRGGAQTVIGGAIARNQSITRSSPLEVLVVSVSIERGQPSIFALGMEEGTIRIGRELFYFEDAEGSKGAQPGRATRASPQSAGYDPSLAGETNELLAPYKERQADGRLRYEQIQISQMSGHFEPEGFALMRDGSPERSDFYELFYYGSMGGGFKNVLRGQFNTPYLKNSSQGATSISNATRRLRLIGRSLLATEPMAHGVGDPCCLVPYLTMSPITGPITNTGIPVKRATLFARNGGYVMIDPGRYGQPMEIISHMGLQGDRADQLRLPRDQRGEVCMRARFGTQPRTIGKDMFAYQMPFRYFDRYEAGIESESMAFLQKSFRVPGAYWRSIEWKVREGKNIKRDRLCDIIVLARFDREADWDEEGDAKGSRGLYLFEETRRRKSGEPAVFDLDRGGDELEIRVYFRYKSGSYMRVRDDIYRDDWKETPVLESLVIEYEKDGAVVRHEELPR